MHDHESASAHSKHARISRSTFSPGWYYMVPYTVYSPLPTVHASVPYFSTYEAMNNVSTYSNILYMPPDEPAWSATRPQKDVGRCAFPTTVQATPTALVRAETSAAASRPRQPASGGGWLMAHGSRGCGAPIGIGAPTRAAAAWPLRRTAPIPPRAAHTPARV